MKLIVRSCKVMTRPVSTKPRSKLLQVQYVLMGEGSFEISAVVRFLTGCDKGRGGYAGIIQKNLDKQRIMVGEIQE